ncbi:MAG: DinB family protein [Hamadaea sp.]|nr:DinB family protein [Hamadaea sp.]
MRDPKSELVRYLNLAKDALVWKLDGLSEYDVRRPLTPTGTNLLGLVKHVAIVTAGYFGDTFGRPFPEVAAYYADDVEDNADLWATEQESRAEILDLYDRAWAHANETFEALSLDSLGRVPWWPAATNEVPLYVILTHMLAELNRHAGHADIVRELIDGAAGMRPDNSNLPDEDADWWQAYHDKVEKAARAAG